MAWNRSSEEKKAEVEKRGGRRNVHLKGLVAGAVVVVGAGVAAWLLWPDAKRPQPTSTSTSTSLIKEVTPAAAPKAEEKKKPTEAEKRAAQIKFYEDKYGTNMPEQIKTVVYFLKNPPERIFSPDVPFQYLRHTSDRQIASLATKDPGTYFLVKPQYGESFNRSFLASLMDKTEVLPDDDEETAAVKNLVNDVKKQICEIQRREGKLPSEIMNEHGAYMYELGQCEEQLRGELAKARRNPDVSDQDLEDLFRAANEIRKKRGLPERKVPDFSRSVIRRRLQGN